MTLATKHITDYDVCQAYHDSSLGVWPYDLLHERTKECLKVCYSAMERAYTRGYIGYGVSLRSGWLTEKGKYLITTEWSGSQRNTMERKLMSRNATQGRYAGKLNGHHIRGSRFRIQRCELRMQRNEFPTMLMKLCNLEF